MSDAEAPVEPKPTPGLPQRVGKSYLALLIALAIGFVVGLVVTGIGEAACSSFGDGCVLLLVFGVVGMMLTVLVAFVIFALRMGLPGWQVFATLGGWALVWIIGRVSHTAVPTSAPFLLWLLAWPLIVALPGPLKTTIRPRKEDAPPPGPPPGSDRW